MKTVSYARLKEEYYQDPLAYLPEGWSGNALDILNIEECPAHDRVLCVLSELFLRRRILRLFAVNCARHTLSLISEEDPRAINACDVAERYALRQATEQEVLAAWREVFTAQLPWDSSTRTYHPACCVSHTNCESAASQISYSAIAISPGDADRQIEVLKELIAQPNPTGFP